MNYEGDEFIRLLEEVERQGGEHLQEKCSPHKYRLQVPKPGKPEAKEWKEHFTSGCGKESKFRVFTSEASAGVDDFGSAAPAVVCAVDDNMGMWPRFKQALQ